LKKSRLSDFLI